MVVVFWSKVDANDGVWYSFVGSDNDLDLVWVMVQAFEGSMNMDLFVLGFDWLDNCVVNIHVVVAEVGDKWRDGDLLDVDSWEDDIVVDVVWQTFLVLFEEVDDPLEEFVESWVFHAGFWKFQCRRGVVPDVGNMWSNSKQLFGSANQASVVSWVDALAGGFDQVSKDVETLWIEDGDEHAMWGEHIAGVNSVDDTSLEFANG